MKKIVNESLGAVHTDILIDKLSRKITKNEIKINDIYCKSYTNDKTKIAGITLIALVITTIFCYDEFIKSSNNKGFLLQTI